MSRPERGPEKPRRTASGKPAPSGKKPSRRASGPGVRSDSLRLRGRDTLELVRSVRRGLAYRYFERTKQALGLSAEQVARLVQITPRTLARRREEGRLRPDESDRVLRLARLFDRAVELFEGDREAARSWLRSPKRALANETPLAFAETEVGAREVEHLIGRLEHGVYS